MKNFRTRLDCQFSAVSVIWNCIYSSEKKSEMPEIFKSFKAFNFTRHTLRLYLICEIYEFKTLNLTETEIK